MTETETKGAGGRPTKFEEVRAKDIIGLLQGGNTIKTAAAAAGIGERTYHDWVAQGKQDEAEGRETDFSQFSQQVALARARAEVLMVDSIRRAARGRPKKKVVTRTNKRVETALKADGTPICDKAGNPLKTEIVETLTTVEEEDVEDWRAAESWLKRRNPASWGDRLDLGKLPNEKLLELLEAAAEADEGITDVGENQFNTS